MRCQSRVEPQHRPEHLDRLLAPTQCPQHYASRTQRVGVFGVEFEGLVQHSSASSWAPLAKDRRQPCDGGRISRAERLEPRRTASASANRRVCIRPWAARSILGRFLVLTLVFENRRKCLVYRRA